MKEALEVLKIIGEKEYKIKELEYINKELFDLLKQARKYLDSGNYTENQTQYLLCKDINEALKKASAI